MPGAAAWTAFETRSTAGASAAIGTAAAIIPSAVAASAAERPLEARTRVAADACGIARKIFAGNARAADSRRTGFAREQNGIVLDDRGFRHGLTGRSSNHFLIGVFDFDVLVFRLLVFSVFVLSMFVFAERRGMLGTLVRGIRGELRAASGTAGFDFLGFFFGEARNFHGWNSFRMSGFFLCFFFAVLFLKFGTTDNSISFGFGLRFLVLGFDKSGSERGDLIVAQFNVTPNGFRLARRRFV
jgi:hypothetical protein